MAIAISIRVAQALLLPLLLSAGTTSADLLRQAEERIQREQFSSAEALLEQTLRHEPGNVQALYRLGYVQYRQRKLSQARHSFAEVVKLAPPAYNSRYFLGRIALLENKHREAIEWFEPVVAGDEITTSVTVKNIYEKGGMQFYVWESASSNQEGAPVVKGTWTNIVRAG